MKHLRSCICMLAAACVAVGPVYADTGNEMERQESTDKQWKETMESLGSYTAEQRDKALEAGRKTLEAMDRRIERMETWTKEHWAQLSDEARQKRTDMLDAMRAQRNKAAEWYGGMKHSSSETWDSVKSGFIRSYDRLQQAYKNAVDSVGSEEAEEDSGN